MASCGMVKLSTIDIADAEDRARLKRFQTRLAILPIDGRGGEPRQIGGDAPLAQIFAFAQQAAQAGDVIGMLMRDEYGVEVFERLPDEGQAPGQFAHAQARIDQDAGVGRGHERRVAGTAAGQHAKLDHVEVFPWKT